MKRRIAATHKTEPIRKDRSIQFAKFPPDQVPEASGDLEKLEDIAVEPHVERHAIGVSYDLQEHSLQELEGSLEDKGYHLDNTLMNKMKRALIYYVEDVQLHNLDAPEKLTKRSQSEAYTHAWERHPHGDHDDTPPEWREYK